MATKAKESSTLVGNERKKTPASITTTKRTTKPSTPTTTSTTNKSNSTNPSEKNIPNYLKPTTSFKQLKTETPIKPSPLRRRSLDKPLSSSNLTAPKQKETSLSRLHKALVSPGPRERSASLTNRSSNVPVKSTNPSKPISNKTPSDAKNKLVGKKVMTKSTLSRNNSTSKTSKKVANDHASSDIPAKIKAVITDSDSSSVETEDVKEVTNQEVEVIKVENEEYVSHEISPDVISELLHEQEHDQIFEDSDIPYEKVISTVSDQEVEEKESQEEEHEEKENNNENQTKEVDRSEVESEVSVIQKEENESGNQIEEADHSEVESEVAMNEKKENESGNQTEEVDRSEVESKVSMIEKEENESGNQTEEVDRSEVESEVAVNEKEENESGNVIEDQKSENNNEEEQGGEEKEAVEGGVSEEVEEVKVEIAQPKQQQLAVKGKNDLSQVSNGMIEETASKLLGRKNKVLALAGAFQTVIDHQIK